jgi:hypothetical protein
MTRRSRQRPLPAGAFWLLLVAWACASMPPAAIFGALTWLAQARSFTHQQRLAQDVARLLGGEAPTTPIADAIDRAQPPPSKPLPAPLSGGTAIKKIELSLETPAEFLPAARRAAQQVDSDRRCPAPRRVAPPRRPPRAPAA